MRLRIFVLCVSLCGCVTAQTQEWNLYAPCAAAGLSERERAFAEEDGQCDPATLASIQAAFAAPPIAELAGEDGQAVRVTVTDGYDNRIVVTEVVRRAGAANALATARGRGDPGRRPQEMMEGELDSDAWDAIARRARDHARARAMPVLIDWVDRRAQQDEEESIRICEHGWSVMIETFGFGRPRVIERNACDEAEESEAIFDLGWSTVHYVFESVPGCDWLDQQFFRNDAARLRFCLGLSGEVAIAASATNAIHPFTGDDLASSRLRYLWSDDFSLTLDGETTVTGADHAFARWTALAASGDYELYFDTASGSEDDRGRETAQLNMLLIDDAWPNGETRFAEVVQTWWRENELWLLQSAQVGPWQIVRWADDD